MFQGVLSFASAFPGAPRRESGPSFDKKSARLLVQNVCATFEFNGATRRESRPVNNKLPICPQNNPNSAREKTALSGEKDRHPSAISAGRGLEFDVGAHNYAVSHLNYYNGGCALDCLR